ncbi:SMP-30/gluconolactonase/LRE family protein [Nocardioides marmoriginsengisoli]|uniref:SMP-30/gluconolactonase/LRE family protein n=1 Tax=Nocardioides marmoriginsengisoli TaxID=661483 RepID=A0A3N0CN07_9ACTN|nr:SMP-30/gluconolactonase/LRE family protein [Nocardioides marmoriginsengisoli]RNL64854.1 SMP-30/gluconolactonase/LRE family protein [Nocardioides marmoriginsengisoli]
MTEPRLLPVAVHPVPSYGAEDVVVADNGLVFTGTEDGSIFAVRPDGGGVDLIGSTGGRPLGIELLGSDRLLIADAHHGLLAMKLRTGALETLVDAVEGRPLVFCNNAAVARNGDIWFSDSSTVFGIEKWKNDFVQHTRTGRLFCLRANGVVEQGLDGLAFANGVALAADESYVAVAESGARTVARLWLTGERAGERDFLCTDLPGYPDNIARGSDGLIWVSIASPVDPLVERIRRGPMALRKAVTAIPEALQPKPRQTVRAMAYDDSGTLVHDVSGEVGGFHMVTGVREHDGRLWLGSLHEPAVAVISLGAD